MGLDSRFVGVWGLHIMPCSRDFGLLYCSYESKLLELGCDEDTLICTLSSIRWMYFGENTLIRTLVSVRWLYFDEDTLICALTNVRWLYFVGAARICTLSNMHCSRDSIFGLDESILLVVEEGTLHSSLDESIFWGRPIVSAGIVFFFEVFVLFRCLNYVFSSLDIWVC